LAPACPRWVSGFQVLGSRGWGEGSCGTCPGALGVEEGGGSGYIAAHSHKPALARGRVGGPNQPTFLGRPADPGARCGCLRINSPRTCELVRHGRALCAPGGLDGPPISPPPRRVVMRYKYDYDILHTCELVRHGRALCCVGGLDEPPPPPLGFRRVVGGRVAGPARMHSRTCCAGVPHGVLCLLCVLHSVNITSERASWCVQCVPTHTRHQGPRR
jgi:hypothetical protein